MGRKYWAIVQKDIRMELRAKDMWVTMVAFVLMVGLLFGFAISPYQVNLTPVFPGILWLSFLFAGMLAVGRGFAHEAEEEALLGLMAAPGDRLAIFAAKVTTAFLFMVAMEVVMSPVLFALMNQGWHGSLPTYLLTLALGTLGFASVGSLFAAIAANSRGGSVLLPVLMAPFAGPVVIFAVEATAGILGTDPRSGGPWPWLHALMAFDALFVALPLLLYEYIWEV
jgi:heme exporter protein B